MSSFSDESFPKEEHLLKTKDFRLVYNEGAAFKKGGFILYRLQNALEKDRIGFSISSRNIKLASRRNRVRRLLRETYRRNKDVLKRGFDIIVVVKRDPPKTISYSDMERTFLALAKDAGILS